jgi:hypothetical protein
MQKMLLYDWCPYDSHHSVAKLQILYDKFPYDSQHSVAK